MNEPTLLVSDEARNRFRDEVAQICRTYHQSLLRVQAIDKAIKRFKEAYLEAFVSEFDPKEPKAH